MAAGNTPVTRGRGVTDANGLGGGVTKKRSVEGSPTKPITPLFLISQQA